MKRQVQTALTVTVFVGSLIAGFFIFRGTSSFSFGNAVEIDWRLLGDMDYVTGKAPSELEALDGKSVRVPGFMVPLEDNSKKVSEFLLVPSPQACIHVPPPPPNQMVLVRMEGGAEVAFGPIWVYGTLQIKSKRHQFGESSFQMVGTRVEAYRPN